jgi:hypothetical protein
MCFGGSPSFPTLNSLYNRAGGVISSLSSSVSNRATDPYRRIRYHVPERSKPTMEFQVASKILSQEGQYDKHKYVLPYLRQQIYSRVPDYGVTTLILEYGAKTQRELNQAEQRREGKQSEETRLLLDTEEAEDISSVEFLSQSNIPKRTRIVSDAPVHMHM